METVEDALQGANDIIAEWVSDDAEIRKHLRALFVQCADVVSSAAKKDPEDTVYRNYYAFRAAVCKV